MSYKTAHKNPYFVVILLLTTTLFYFSSMSTYACSCSAGSVKDKFKSSFSVFSGKANKIDYLQSANGFGDQNIIVYFENPIVYKGGKNTTLDTAYNGAGCTGYWFKEGEEYLIYAFKRDDGSLDTMWCGGVISKSENHKAFNKEIKKIIKLTK